MTTPAHAIRQRIGSRSHQCDAARARTDTHRAYVLLDGIGSDPNVQAWVRRTTTTLAGNAAKHGAELALRRAHERAAKAQRDADRRDDRWDDQLPSAVAVAATVVDGTLTVAWCGDARAYLWGRDGMRRLTTDHNERQQLLDLGVEPGSHARNIVTSYLGDTGDEPRIGVVSVPAVGRLILASDGAYEPLEDVGENLADFAQGPVGVAAADFVRAAVRYAGSWADNATVLITDL